MKKITRFTIGLLLIFSSCYSQKELWGYRTVYNYFNPQIPGINDGKIVKMTLGETGSDSEIMHEFDVTGLLGKFPRGRLLQASNGKLYGVTGFAGMAPAPGIPPGVLFEYDLVFNQYRVLYSNLTFSQYSLIEAAPGMLYGVMNGGSSIFKYNIDTEQFTVAATIAPFVYNGSNTYPQLRGELMKASDGNLYAVTPMAPSVQNIPYPGGIYRFNPNTNQISKVYVFGTLGSNVQYPVEETKLIEGLPGKLYGTAMGGDYFGPQGVAPIGSGTIFEFTIATATLAKKFDFNYNTTGSGPSPIIKVGDKLYGTVNGVANYPNTDGALFEYNLTTEAFSLIHVFDYAADDLVKTPYGFPLKATDGNFYGSCLTGVYKLNPETNTVTKKAQAVTSYDAQSLIEICRKPSYHFFETASFMACQNNPFTFDVQNTNATSYVWKKGSSVLASQTTGVLAIANLTLADTGIYTCTMTNECGTTVTMPLQLTVENCLGVEDAAALKNGIRLYPNPAANILNVQKSGAVDFEIQQIAISNMLGQVVYSNSYSGTAIDVSFLQNGVYQLQLKTDKGDWNGKFVKQ